MTEGAGGGTLGVGEVRVAVRAAGVNFRDVLAALGMYPGEVAIGGEGAGVVLEVGPGVEDLAVGDRVMGLLDGAFGSVAVTDRRLLVPVPEEWSLARAASVPVAFLTAYYALVDLADVQRRRASAGALGGRRGGNRCRAAGGVSRCWRCAARLARGSGPRSKGSGWSVSGSPPRATGVRRRFVEAGVNVVLDSLAREYVDASLGLLGEGGPLFEMGKTDIREAGAVEAAFPGVAYRPFDLIDAGPERVQELLRELVALFEQACWRGCRCGRGTWRGARGVAGHEPGAAHRQERARDPGPGAGGRGHGLGDGRHGGARRVGGKASWRSSRGAPSAVGEPPGPGRPGRGGGGGGAGGAGRQRDGRGV